MLYRILLSIGIILFSTSSFSKQDFSGSVCADRVKHTFCPVLHLDYDSPINSVLTISPNATNYELRGNKCIHHMFTTGCDFTCETDMKNCKE